MIGEITLGETLARLDGLDLSQPLIGLFELGEGDLLLEQRLLLRTHPSVALDGAAHALGGQTVGVILALDEDEAARAAVRSVGLQNGVRSGARAGEAVENKRVILWN